MYAFHVQINPAINPRRMSPCMSDPPDADRDDDDDGSAASSIHCIYDELLDERSAINYNMPSGRNSHVQRLEFTVLIPDSWWKLGLTQIIQTPACVVFMLCKPLHMV